MNVIAFKKPNLNIRRLEQAEDDFEYLMSKYNYRDYLIPLSEFRFYSVLSKNDIDVHLKMLVKNCIESILIPVVFTKNINPVEDITEEMEDLVEDMFYVLMCIKHLSFIYKKYHQVCLNKTLKEYWLKEESKRFLSDVQFYDRNFKDKLWFCSLDYDLSFDSENRDNGIDAIDKYLFRLSEFLMFISRVIGRYNLICHNVDGSNETLELSRASLFFGKSMEMSYLSYRVAECVLDKDKELSYSDILKLYYAAIND